MIPTRSAQTKRSSATHPTTLLTSAPTSSPLIPLSAAVTAATPTSPCGEPARHVLDVGDESLVQVALEIPLPGLLPATAGGRHACAVRALLAASSRAPFSRGSTSLDVRACPQRLLRCAPAGTTHRTGMRASLPLAPISAPFAPRRHSFVTSVTRIMPLSLDRSRPLRLCRESRGDAPTDEAK